MIGPVLALLSGIAGAADGGEASVDVDEVDLSELMKQVGSVGSGGTFGSLLRRYNVEPFLHGFTALDLGYDGDDLPAFDFRGFTLVVGADVAERVVPEVAFQLTNDHAATARHTWEGSGEEVVALEHSEAERQPGQLLRLVDAHVDWRTASPWATVRIGLFPLPLGAFNERGYAEFVTRTVLRPIMYEKLLPVPSPDVGVALLGEGDGSGALTFGYTLYVTNGLEVAEHDADAHDPEQELAGNDGPHLSQLEMRHNFLGSESKAVGTRIWLHGGNALTLGLSGYAGPYTDDGLWLGAGAVDLALVGGPLRLEAEGLVMLQELEDGIHPNPGAYVVATANLSPAVAPGVQGDFVYAASEGSAALARAGVVLLMHPYPSTLPSAVVKVGAFAVDIVGDAITPNLTIEAAVGF